jgi:hypothetical protein
MSNSIVSRGMTAVSSRIVVCRKGEGGTKN